MDLFGRTSLVSSRKGSAAIGGSYVPTGVHRIGKSELSILSVGNSASREDHMATIRDLPKHFSSIPFTSNLLDYPASSHRYLSSRVHRFSLNTMVAGMANLFILVRWQMIEPIGSLSMAFLVECETYKERAINGSTIVKDNLRC